VTQECHELDAASEETLVKLAQGGDHAAANLLFSRQRSVLYRAALRYLKNPADAEDAIQDGLLLAHRHLGQFEGRARFQTWLVSIILNTARARIRRGCRRRTLSIEDGLHDPASNPIKGLHHAGPGPDQIFAIEERRQILARTLAYLPADFRRALYLTYVKGLSVREAACVLGINPETFKARLFRGKRKLARSLSSQNQDVHHLSQIQGQRNENGAAGRAIGNRASEGLLACKPQS
jgi:RNA polymerase sigma-70 factor, ECF subfamily